MSGTVHVVQRLNWVRIDPDDKSAWYGLLRLPGATRLASFTDPDEAERDYRKREEEARRMVNPFSCGGPSLPYQTRFEAAILHDWICDLGIEPPPNLDGLRDWIGWWDREHDSWNEYQRTRIWEAFDRVRFHEIVERPVCPIVYVVVEVGWLYNDEGYDACDEGGRTIKAFRTRQKAEAARERMEQERRNRDGVEGFDLSSRVLRQQNPFEDAQRDEVWADEIEQAFFEIVEIEYGE